MAEFDTARGPFEDANSGPADDLSTAPTEILHVAATNSRPLAPPAPVPPTAEPVVVAQIARPSPAFRALGWVLPFAVFALVLVGVLYAAPMLLIHWRLADSEAQAEAAYQRRRAELRAESEAAQEFISVLDKKSQLTSLGFRKVVQTMTPKVVNIASYRELKPGDPSHGPKLGPEAIDPSTGQQYAHAGVGSGLIVKPGFILTNHHVVRKVDRLRVTFASGQSVWVDMARVSSDVMTDLAVIRLPENPADGLKDDYNQTAEFADSSKDVECGDWVLALGSPKGLKNTVTHGVISAKGRFLDKLERIEVLQTDTPINPGNSGGPLFDLYGKVVGINVAIVSDSGHSEGIGFAIPSNTAKAVFEELIAKGEVVRGFIGVEMEELSPMLARDLKLADKGVVAVKRVVPGLPADKGGLKKGDLIVALDGKNLPLTEPLSFFRQRIMEAPVGTPLKLGVVRLRQRGDTKLVDPAAALRHEHRTITVTVAAKPRPDL